MPAEGRRGWPPRGGLEVDAGRPRDGRARCGQASPRAPAARTLAVQACLLVLFTLARAVHPLVISKTKVAGRYPHEPLTVPLVECFVTLVLAQAIAVANGGLIEWIQIWNPKPLVVFSIIGLVYALGDYLELKSLESLSGTTYQVLMQSKLIVTAAMVYGIKGQKQSLLQWILLVLVVLALCCYSIMTDLLTQHRQLQADPESRPSAGESSAIGVLTAILKVVVSCLCAVLSDKFMKDFKGEPIYMMIVQIKVAWCLMLLALISAEGGSAEHGYLHEWRPVTAGALLSFTVKTWSTMYFLALLDSMLKNIGEACSVLVTYLFVVFHASFDDEYEAETFVVVLVVVLSVAAYLAAGDVVTRAERYDATCQAGPAAASQMLAA